MADFQEEVYIIERKEITDDEDDDEEFEALQREAEELANLSQEDLEVDLDEDVDDLNDFATLKLKATQNATKRGTKTTGVLSEMAGKPVPKVLERDVVIDDFIRNFLQRFGMKKSMNTFQQEWYELQKKGVFQDNGIGLITDVTNKNSRLSLKIEKMSEELKQAKVKAEQAKSTWDKLRKERDFHKNHQIRVEGEKVQVNTSIKEMKSNFSSYEDRI